MEAFFASHNSPCQARPPHLLPGQILIDLYAFLLLLSPTSTPILHIAASVVFLERG